MNPVVSQPIQFPILLVANSFKTARLARPALAPLVGLLPHSEKMPLEVMTVQPRLPLWGTATRSARLRLRFRPKTIVGTSGQIELEAEPSPLLDTTPAWEEIDRLSGLSTTVPGNGRPTVQILQRAQSLRAGMIAISTQSSDLQKPASSATRSDEWMLRSMAAIVARQAPCPVLMIPPVADSLPKATWKHILLLVTERDVTQGAIALTRQLIPTGVEQITVLAIQPPLNTRYLFSPFMTSTPDWQFHRFLQQVQQERSEEQVKRVAIALQSAGVSVKTWVQTGNVGTIIQSAAQQVDLIVTGNPFSRQWVRRHAPSILKSLRLWAMTEAVLLQSPCPILMSQSHHRGLFFRADRHK